jgi:hypothetical protein
VSEEEKVGKSTVYGTTLPAVCPNRFKPGLNDSEASVRSIAAFLAKLEPERSYVEVRRGGKDEVARRAAWSGRRGTGDVGRATWVGRREAGRAAGM